MLIAGAAAMFAVLMIAIGVSSGILVRRFDAIEVEQTHGKARQVVRALEADLNQLAISTRDYAEWDDAQQYFLHREPKFLEANFSVDSLQGMQVDVLAILAADGSAIYTAQLDEAGKRLIEPAPANIIAMLGALRHDSARLRELNSTRRILRTPQGLLAFSGIEICRSDKSAPTGAVMFFARFLHADEIERVRQTSQLAAELLPLEQGATTLPATVRSWLTTGASTPTQTSMDGDQQISGYAVVRDLSSTPVALLATHQVRSIAALGRATTETLMGTIATLLLICGAGLLFMMLRLRESWADRAALESRHRNILGYLDETIVIADPATGRIVDVNQALLRVLDYERADLQRLTLQSVYVGLPETRSVAPGEVDLLECRMRARDGKLVDAEVTFKPVIEDGRELICVVGRDVSLRKQAEATLRESVSRLAHVSEHDELTGLPNRGSLHELLSVALQKAASNGGSLLLLHIDIDNFKNVNDSRGHAFGDRAIKVIGQRLKDLGSEAEMLARMGGDEFVIALAGATDAAFIQSLTARLRSQIAAPLTIEDITLELTASIGVAVYPGDGLDADSLLKHADIALYEAKEAGRNTYRVFSSDMNVQLGEHIALEQALRRALNTGEIYLEYQPVIDLQTGLLVSFEALARWKHPELGQIPPVRFIPVAEKSGLIVQLGEHVARSVILQLRQWRDGGVPLAPIAVNVAPAQFERSSFCTFVHELMLEHDIDPSWLAFEVTESAWLQDSTKHIVMIDVLRHAGSKVYIDDFGTGFSNLSYLKTLPVDAVKIDQAFVRTITTDASDEVIVSGIISIAQKLRLITIAEGIETAEQADRLRSMGCRLGQGYYFSKPMPAANCRALLEQVGATRRFTETVKMRAFRSLKSA